MSAQTIAEAIAPAIQRQKENVMIETWGHLAPKPNNKYAGYILFCWASNGDLTPIDYAFESLDGSPWFYGDIMDFIEKSAKEEGKVYRFDGTYQKFKTGTYRFSGKTKIVKCE